VFLLVRLGRSEFESECRDVAVVVDFVAVADGRFSGRGVSSDPVGRSSNSSGERRRESAMTISGGGCFGLPSSSCS
jgi:hypothetical protein